MNNEKKVLIIDDEQSMIKFLAFMFETDGFAVSSTTDGKEGIEIAKNILPDVVICDVKMEPLGGLEVLEAIKNIDPSIIVIMITAYASIEMAINAMKKGAYDYILKPFKIDEIRMVVKKALERESLITENKYLKQQLNSTYIKENIIGNSLAMQEVFQTIKRISHAKTNVLLTGKSGTGKELIAKAIHANSLCKDNKFIAINCGSMPANLLESELFGHVKGAFTDAHKDKEGLFQTANNGTFFLDEIGDMPIELQTKLLRVIQEKEIRKIGSNETIKIDVRIIAATNKNIKENIKNKTFREDLFYRLSVININLPSLYERKDDIPLLVNFFIKKYTPSDFSLKIDKETLSILKKYSWPGNVRELENAVERAVVLCEKEILTLEDFPEYLQATFPEINNIKGSLKDKIDTVEKNIIEEALSKENGNQFQTAKKLGVTRQNLQYKIKKYKLKETG